ncbi:MAG: addiction module protein [Calothrix sp. MO_167.B42]|nr:addiction module protein [Calothrix sp. MO_167.B42]
MLPIEQLTEEALALPNELKVALVEKLLDSLTYNIEPNIQTAWISEAKQRRDEILNGIVKPIPGEEALAEVRRLLEQ